MPSVLSAAGSRPRSCSDSISPCNPECGTEAVAELSEEGFLRTHREDLLAEAIHAVGPKGKAIAEERGIDGTAPADVPQQIEHFEGVNDIRIAVESGAIRVAYSIVCSVNFPTENRAGFLKFAIRKMPGKISTN